ncbi:MAG: hypothetical protein IRZ00_16190 [Gemmatimonadetes bacterium]|nr:hypothetical protein [Gemmatimonadota bacterium]
MDRRVLLLGLVLLLVVPSLARAQRGGAAGRGAFSGGFRGHDVDAHRSDGRSRSGFLLHIGTGPLTAPLGLSALTPGVVLPPWGPGTGFARGIDRRSVEIARHGLRDGRRFARTHRRLRGARFGLDGAFLLGGVALAEVGCDCVVTETELVAEPVTYGVTTNVATPAYVLPARADSARLREGGHVRSQVTEIVYGGRGGSGFHTITRYGDAPASSRP